MQRGEPNARNLVLLRGCRCLPTRTRKHDLAVHKSFMSIASEVIILSHSECLEEFFFLSLCVPSLAERPGILFAKCTAHNAGPTLGDKNADTDTQVSACR